MRCASCKRTFNERPCTAFNYLAAPTIFLLAMLLALIMQPFDKNPALRQ